MFKFGKARGGLFRPARRRGELRRNLPRPTVGVWSLLQRRDFINASLILTIFTLLTTLLVVWSRDQVHVTAGQIMTDTRVNRLEFHVEDLNATEKKRDDERERSPDVYLLNRVFLDDLRSAFRSLPVIVSQQTDLESILPKTRQDFGLDEASLEHLAAFAEDGKPTADWAQWVDELIDDYLPFHPLLNDADWQRGMRETEPPLLLDPRTLGVRTIDGQPTSLDIRRIMDPEFKPDVAWSAAILIPSGDDENTAAAFERSIRQVVRSASFPTRVIDYIVAGLVTSRAPTYVLSADDTDALSRARAEAVEIERIYHGEGEIIYQRGELLTEASLGVLRQEIERWRAEGPRVAVWLPRIGIFGLLLVLILLTYGLILGAYERILRNATRLIAICTLMVSMLALTTVLAGKAPQLLFPAALAPMLFVATILQLSYDRRLALFLSMVQCALVALALNAGVAWFILLMTGCGTMIAQLREVRHRSSLIRAAITTAGVLGVGTVFVGIFNAPVVEGIWIQILSQGAWAVAASLVVGFLVLGILPSVERLFDITTGMTLAELRDPSQPLLRQLQQRAPGTYNHSLQVANIAEAAAEAIGADSLLLYVGALYHDIGKMNKPEYFVENQTTGFNKHSKLRPAMSLLVIVGHVKDGIELGREYGLPRAIQHFIASHHGTTLVEYFYHAAKTEAETDEKSSVDEVEFRYPGPRPRAKEAAILMLADAVESATRAMSEPNPGRIESLVRELSQKRLLDGQFNECDLTFRELGLIEDAIIARVCAIHHGRIAYPSAKAEEVVAETA